MLDENNNLKDSTSDVANSYRTDVSLSVFNLSYKKTNKLISALYMVTDIMDREEPLRNKLRNIGSNIVSDIHTLSLKTFTEAVQAVSVTKERISEIVSFLDIASSVGMISEMNCNILKKEFFELKQSIIDHSQNNNISLSNFFAQTESISDLPAVSDKKIDHSNGQLFKRHTPIIPPVNSQTSTRIGVQKGSTLLRAISEKIPVVHNNQNFDSLKKERRDIILKIIKDMKDVHPEAGRATIKDIKDKAFGSLLSCGEKTLQRELVSMIKDKLLTRKGEKRWCKYSI
ncbi:MAG: hypothetical protein NTZ44_03400 [Candidatus Nomurabacteria bacterium]|nr:hypothetical protein [Candidatus Nomurabacteria bacterium]